MGKYIHYFSTESEFSQERNNNYTEPWVSYTEGKGIDYNKSLYETPFTIEALGSGDITWALADKTVQYSKNGGSWEMMNGRTTISVIQGDEVQFKGNNAAYIDEDDCGLPISSTARFNVKGNIMSLTDGDDFMTADTVGKLAFSELFMDCIYLISADKLKLPVMALEVNCYKRMFYGCTNLITAPELPATALTYNCYHSMFYGCTSLTTAPELPAMTLASNCYSNMFQNCTNLITAPELPATALTYNCYDYMFRNCTSLTTAPELPATALANYCYRGMFYGCTNLVTAPELPAETLINHCYDDMFRNCSSLNYIKAMFLTAPSTGYTSGWVNGVAATGTFVKNASAQWNVTGVNGIPSGWTVQTAAS